MTDAKFSIALRGYERRQVDALVERAKAGEDVRNELKHLIVVLRGYDRQEVDDFFASVQP